MNLKPKNSFLSIPLMNLKPKNSFLSIPLMNLKPKKKNNVGSTNNVG